jgi:CDP-glycerol glycerophosphotransferase (TagB/SpsB family)
VLVQFQPKVVIGIDIPKSLVVSAKDRNVSVIELYHGFGRGPNNAVYFSKFKGEEKSKEWPTEIIVYDDQSYKTLTKMLPDMITVILARNYWFDFLETVGQKYLSSVRSSLEDKLYKYQKVVLVSLQHGYDGSREYLAGILDNGLIHSNILKLIDDRKDILFVLKPHPVQVASSDWKNVWRFLNSLEEANDNVVFERVVNTDIFSLLMLSDAHMTMSSSAIYEAGLLERPSIALCPTLQKGGFLQDAFKAVEDKGLLTRAKLNGLDLVQFFDNPAHFTKTKKKHAGYNEYAQPAASKVDTILKKAD